jgi:hypothetical protein
MSVRWILATLALLAPAFAAGCKRPVPTPPPDAPWSIAIVSARPAVGGEGTGVVRCAIDGTSCAPLQAKDPLPPGSLLRVAQGGSATVSLDASVTASFAPDTEILVNDGPERVVSVKHGAFVLSYEPPAGTASPLPSLRFPGGALSIATARAAALSIAVERLGVALVTVHRGLASLLAGSGPAVEIAAGQTMRVATDGVVDRRAGFRGELAFAEVAAAGVTDAADTPRGLGTMSARVPGTDRIVAGVRLASHQVRAFIRDGFARTEVEEVFQNDTDQVLEGRYAFPLPADASISRLGLWVGDKLVEGEMVESKRAAIIFKSIVDDTVRPRDPALLEWVKGSEFSLKIFPLPAHGKRQVVLAYNQVLSTAGGRVRYAYPLSLGKDRAVRVGELGIQVRVENTAATPHDPVTPHYAPTLETTGADLTATYSARDVSPDADFVLAYRQDVPDGAVAAAYVPELGELVATGAPKAPATTASDGRYVALRVHADLPDDMPPPERRPTDRAIVIDVSQSQSADTIAATSSLVKAILTDMDADERFAILACDGACASYPPTGMAVAEGASLVDILQWLGKLAPGGSTDLGNALNQAAQRLGETDRARQIVYVGDGAPTSGELTADTIAARVKPALRRFDLRLLGAGRTVDEVTLAGLAQALGGTYERVSTGEPISQRASAIALALRAPVVVAPRIEVPAGLADVFPRTLPNLPLGQEIVVLGRASGAAPLALRLAGTLGERPFSVSRTFTLPTTASGQNPLVPRLWAEQRIRDREAAPDARARAEVLDLSHRFHVMSRYTSLLVLESDKMFADFGIERTTHAASDQSDEGFAPGGAGGRAASGGGAPSSKATSSLSANSAALEAQMRAARGAPAPPPPAMAPAPAARSAPPAAPRPRPSAPRSRALATDFEGGGGGYYAPPPPPRPHGTVVRSDDAWMTQGQAELDKLNEDVARNPTSRRKLEALVRGLLGKGRLSDALPAARRFVELDPDLPVASELLSFAAAFAGDGPLSVATVDATCEADPKSVRAHLRAAKAFEASGSELRACGHWRSLAELEPANDDYRYESLRCRARAMAQPARVIEELHAQDKRSKRLDELMKLLEAGTLPTYAPDKESEGALEVTVTCDGAPNECPVPVVLSPLGTVYSPWTPGDARTTARGVAFSRITSGAYRVLLVGGAPTAHGEVNVRALDGHLKVAFAKGGAQTVALATLRL